MSDELRPTGDPETDPATIESVTIDAADIQFYDLQPKPTDVSLRICNHEGRALVTLRWNGEVEFDPADLTEAAQTWWSAVRRVAAAPKRDDDTVYESAHGIALGSIARDVGLTSDATEARIALTVQDVVAERDRLCAEVAALRSSLRVAISD